MKPYWLRDVKRILPRLNKIIQLINNKPKTVRNISYKLYPDLEGKELDKKYNLTIKDTVILRMSNLLPFRLIKESRSCVYEIRNVDSINDMIEYFESIDLSKCYVLNRKSSFKSYIEVWFEKDTVFDIFKEVCDSYTIPMLCVRGKSQLSSIYKGFKRFEGKKGDILFFGDLDKSGIQNFNDIRLKFRYWKSECSFHWCGVTREQLETFNVRGHRLDGFDSDDLRKIIDSCIQNYFDYSKMKKLDEQEEQDKKELKNYQIKIIRKGDR